jgi:DTW domain-containing protein YfiP
MHHKEHFSAGDDAKLLLAMLPQANAELFVFGREGDWARFSAETSVDPVHTLTLWPGEEALTVAEFVAQLPATEAPGWQSAPYADPPVCLPVLRVVVLDGTYTQARNMFKAMKKNLPHNPPFIALHPSTLSVYHRAQKKYAAASGQTVQAEESDLDPEALRICTVEVRVLLRMHAVRTACVLQAAVLHAVNSEQHLTTLFPLPLQIICLSSLPLRMIFLSSLTLQLLSPYTTGTRHMHCY